MLDHPRNAAALLLFAGLASCACAATIAAVTLAMSGSIDWGSLPETWLTWAILDLAGIYMLAPAILAWSEGDSARLKDRDRAIVPIWILALTLSCLIAFLDAFQAKEHSSLAFLPIPLVIYFSYRFNDRLACVVAPLVAAAAIVATANNRGPFGFGETNLALIQLQVFTLVGILTALFTRAITNERNAAEREARRSSSELAHLTPCSSTSTTRQAASWSFASRRRSRRSTASDRPERTSRRMGSRSPSTATRRASSGSRPPRPTGTVA